MRILVIPSWFPSDANPLTGSFFVEQAEMLRSAGHEVTVLVPSLVPLPRWRGLNHSTEMMGALRVHRVAVPALPVVMQPAENRMMSAVVKKVLSTIAVEKPDIVHAHSVMPAAIVAREISIQGHVPYVITEHSPSSLERRTDGPRARLLFQSVQDAQEVATVSRSFADAIEDHYAIPEVQVIELPVPEQYFESALDGTSGSYEFLHVSHLSDNKRVSLTLEALAALGGDARLTVVGGSDERVRELRAEAERVGVGDKTTFLGQRGRDEIPVLMSRANCLVLASAVEAGGTVISEAKSSGAAVVATKTWGGMQGVGPEEGRTSEIDSCESLSSAMRDAMESGMGVGPEWRRNQREKARRRYSRDIFVDNQIRFYETAIKRFEGTHAVFHAPYPIDPKPSSASRLRPKMMLGAMYDRGIAIHRVTGNPRQRALGYSDIRRRIRHGASIDYLYSENSTQPNVLATSVKHGIAPLLDARILRYMDRHRIPAGEFYRDVYWRFPGSQASAPLFRRWAMQVAYRFDVAVLRALKTHVFLPSLAMGPVVPLPQGRYSALPPGCEIHEASEPDGVSLFYVGGLGPDYGMHMCVEAVAATHGVSLTMVVPARDWERYKFEYIPIMDESIDVAFAKSHELQDFYDAASACVLFVEPTEYRKFAAPVKFYEYMSYGKPALLSKGTLAGKIGEDLGIGIAVDHTPEAFKAQLERLRDDPTILHDASRRAREERMQNTWSDRVGEMQFVLLGDSAEKDPNTNRPASKS